MICAGGKIAIMGAWNTDSGASFHCEMLSKSLKIIGYDVIVFTFYDWSFFGTQIFGEHEDYVIAAFSTTFGSKAKSPSELNTIPFLTLDYQFFIVGNLGTLPINHLRKIFHHIKMQSEMHSSHS